MSNEADTILEGILGGGIQRRSDARKIRHVFDDHGLTRAESDTVLAAAGLPGTDSASIATWCAIADKTVPQGNRPKAFDWQALIAQLLPIFLAALSNCGATP
jgi:hypothetical protein